MADLDKVYWYNQLKTINDNFEAINTEVESLEQSALEPAGAVANLAATTAITTVPGSFSDLASVQTYLSGANMVPNIQARLSGLETKVNALLTSLRAAGIIES